MKRLNIRVSDLVFQYYTDEAARLGIARSALMAMALETQIEQKNALQEMPLLINAIVDLQEKNFK